MRQEPLALAKLTEWAVEARYPGDLPDADEADAREAVDIAERVLDYITGDLEEQGFAPDR